MPAAPPPLPWAVPVELIARSGPRSQRGEGLVLLVTAVRADPVSRGALGTDAGLLVATATVDGRDVLVGIVRDVEELAAAWPCATVATVATVAAAAAPSGSSDSSARTLASVLAGLGSPLPVLVGGTTLSVAVLRALATVPLGETLTYAELAARAGAPRAVRAAAHVMATNVVPFVLPCHRVVPAAGGIGRYGWGSDMKARLLELERSAAGGHR
jgi:methylated-DNA-[protein]-cysteine S-methyltransferase